MASMSWKDMVGADKEARTPAPAGRYVLEVTKATLGHKKSNEDVPQWSLVCKIAEGAQKGKTVFLRLTFDPTNASLTMAFDNIRRLGIDPGAQDLLTQDSAKVFEGRRFEGELTTTEFQGNLRNELRSIVKPLVSGVPSGVGAPPPVGAPAAPTNPLAKPKAV